ncbi:hypothetical protein CC86DRAFT_24923 [Ophiobolus disseminans]|uniref:SWIRM domain-containing protein n=1 Tax=Ophiobolus disseminans TaxID=1469910 RepID=A0A6A7A0M0_9PLEO|nr:hypothetical protein CC86DRAFT_24923 [Ophiobolus disseminans]
MANLPQLTPPSHRLTVSSLLSPPEMKRSESFGSSTAPAFDASYSFNSQSSKGLFTAPFNSQIMAFPASLAPLGAAYASPPISPYDTQSQKENIDCVEEQGARDPQLFASGSTSVPIALDEPLFPQESSQEPTGPTSEDVVSQYMKSAHYARLKSKPSREEYELVVSFRSRVFELASKNPRAWRERERQFEQHYGRPTGVQKRQPLKKLAPAPSSKPRQQKVALPKLPPRAHRVPKAKRTPKTQLFDSFDQSPVSASPKPARLSTNRDDTDYHALPDYSPSVDTLPKGNPKCLKAEWKGQPLDLTNDPDRGMLHEAELNLASTLRLTCAMYLSSKRRVFMARIEALKIGKEFRKTDAQQACKIDVNKASKLWQSFEKVGWFKPDYFRQYL